jgi:hypothetical protein
VKEINRAIAKCVDRNKKASKTDKNHHVFFSSRL